MIEIRDLLAALWLDQDLDDGTGFSAEWAHRLIRDYRDAAHDGDCTDQCYTCTRCQVDMAFTAADVILAELGKAGYEIRAR